VYSCLAEWEEAEELWAEIVAIREKPGWHDESDLLRSIANLALAYRHRGQYAAAEDLERRMQMTEKEEWDFWHFDSSGRCGTTTVADSFSNSRGLERTRLLLKGCAALWKRQLGHNDAELTAFVTVATVYRTFDLF
jgi:hypothetical protein